MGNSIIRSQSAYEVPPHETSCRGLHHLQAGPPLPANINIAALTAGTSVHNAAHPPYLLGPCDGVSQAWGLVALGPPGRCAP
jgi:hypothetical protein